MRANGRATKRHYSDRGSSLYMVAGGMVLLLAVSALAIDLVSFYVVRNEAQRAADAAALGGASIFLSEGCTDLTLGCGSGGPQPCDTAVTTRATEIANQNPVGGAAPTAATIDVSCRYDSPGLGLEPQITVTVYRDRAHSNAMPTFFAKIFGVNTVDVAAAATAEAFNPSGSNVMTGTTCLKPLLVPNCDPDHLVPLGDPRANTLCGTVTSNCPGGAPSCYTSYFFDPNSSPPGKVVNPGQCTWSSASNSCTSGSGVVGEPWELHTEAAPSQWYELAFSGQSAAAWEADVISCDNSVLTCGTSIPTLNGKKVGPNNKAIDTLIHTPNQDTICAPCTWDTNKQVCSPASCGNLFSITGGNWSGNPLAGKSFTQWSGSPSAVSVAVYDGSPLVPGGSNATIVGFMEMFIAGVVHTGTDDIIFTYILGVGGCGTAPGGSPPLITGESPIPIRLIHQ